MSVDFEDLRWAVTASEHHSLRRAAEALHILQPTLSRRLRGLEERLGTRLFERTTGGTWPTEDGRDFLDAARHIIAEMDAITVHFKDRSRGESGRLTMGVCASFSAGNLYTTLIDYRKRFPGVGLRVVDRARGPLLSDVAADRIDIAIVMGTRTDRSLDVLPLWTERVVAALPESHPLSAHPVLRWEHLAGACMVVNRRDPGPEFQRLLAARIGPDGLDHVMEHDVESACLLSLVGAGFGIALAAEGAVGMFHPAVVFREIHEDGGPTRLTFAACWRHDNGNPALRPLLGMLRERYPDLSASSPLAAS